MVRLLGREGGEGQPSERPRAACAPRSLRHEGPRTGLGRGGEGGERKDKPSLLPSPKRRRAWGLLRSRIGGS